LSALAEAGSVGVGTVVGGALLAVEVAGVVRVSSSGGELSEQAESTTARHAATMASAHRACFFPRMNATVAPSTTHSPLSLRICGLRKSGPPPVDNGRGVVRSP
jgi:hypothetical protein